MIQSIKELQNLGKYEHYCREQEFGKHQIVFGFNGTGKSTLSDMFYSLAGQKPIPIDRRTLDKVNGEQAGEIEIVLGTDIGDAHYSEFVMWDKELSVFTFNEQYVKDYVFVNQEYTQDIALLAMGSEGVKLAREKQGYIDEVTYCVQTMSDFISAHKELCGELGMGKTKIKGDNAKRLEAIKNIKLFPLSSQTQIQDELKNNVEFSQEAITIKQCMDMFEQISVTNTYISVTDLKKTLSLVPAVKNSEIQRYVIKRLKKDNVSWLVSGLYNQKNTEVCPFCGQRIESDDAKHFMKMLQEYVKSKMQIKAEKIIEDVKGKIASINVDDIAKGAMEYQELLKLIEKEKIFPESIQKRMRLESEWNDVTLDYIRAVVEKLWEKVENPYQSILLNGNEIQCINMINKLTKRIEMMKQQLQIRYEKVVNKVKNEKDMKQKQTLYEASYGEYREKIIEIIKLADQVQKLNAKIKETTQKIDDCYDRVKLKRINELLKELNIKFSVEVRERQYYLKLKDYVPQKYDKEKNKICSEGEKRILAFAYFMSELEEKQNIKTVVIDDPITSLDLSRKSVIAYRIAELIRKNSDQVIVMTHDIAFVEQILEFSGDAREDISLLEIKNRENIFYPLDIKNYLLTDEKVYENFIRKACTTNSEIERIIGLMSLRPYCSIVAPDKYADVEKKSTYFAHTRYAHNGKRNIFYDEQLYNEEGLRRYVETIIWATKLQIDKYELVPEGYHFYGFEYENIKNMYLSINLDNVIDARMKAMLLRVALEACLFQLTTKSKFDPERIGNEYKKVIGSSSKEKKKIAQKLKELYDLSKKYHHGADEGSTLGLSWINPDEFELFDEELKNVFEWIDANCTIKALAA